MASLASITPLSTDRTVLREQLERLCRHRSTLTARPSGFAELDAYLPGGGWPVGALTECLLDQHGIGELSLWLPALRAILKDQRYVAFVAPPFIPYAPAFVQRGIALDKIRVLHCPTQEDSLWATEQALRCSAFGAVFAWPKAIADKQLRRLQLAAEEGRNIGVLYRPLAVAKTPSPAALRIKLRAVRSSPVIDIDIHKCRGTPGNFSLQCAVNRCGLAPQAQAS
jgi:protein ImuA